MIKLFDQFLNERELPDSQGKILVMLGPPGSGKGTLSKELKKNFGFQHISTGDVIRNSEDEELKKLVAGGNLVPDDLMVKILRQELKKLDLEKGIIFDGFPRTIKQARRLDRMLGKLGVGLNHAILLDVDEETSKKRISKRAEKGGRKDDADEEVIQKRLDDYEEKTAPLVDLYQKSRKLIKIDADKGKEEVLRQVTKRLGLKSKKEPSVEL